MSKIMLVEDDNNLREIYQARLLAEGYEIVSAKDGEEALALAVKEKPDLIIADVMMPKISGFDMLDILRTTPETKDTKVIMMTALSQAEDKARADKLGADRYLVKSQVTLEDVVKVSGEVLEGKKPGEVTAAQPGPTASTTASQDPTQPNAPALSTPPAVTPTTASPPQTVVAPATTPPQPSVQAPPVTVPLKIEEVGEVRKKVIQPLNDVKPGQGPDLQALMAAEEKKAEIIPPQSNAIISPNAPPPTVTASPQGPAVNNQAPGNVVTPGSQPGQAATTGTFDPTKIAL